MDLLVEFQEWQRLANPMLLLTILNGVAGVLMLTMGIVIKRMNKKKDVKP